MSTNSCGGASPKLNTQYLHTELSLHAMHTVDLSSRRGNSKITASTVLTMLRLIAHAKRRTAIVAISENCGVYDRFLVVLFIE